MSGRRLILSLSRRSSTLQSVSPRKHLSSHAVYPLTDARVPGSPTVFERLREGVTHRKRSLYWSLLHHKLLSTDACLEQTMSCDEASCAEPCGYSPKTSAVPEDASGISRASIAARKDSNEGDPSELKSVKRPSRKRKVKVKESIESFAVIDNGDVQQGCRPTERGLCEPINYASRAQNTEESPDQNASARKIFSGVLAERVRSSDEAVASNLWIVKGSGEQDISSLEPCGTSSVSGVQDGVTDGESSSSRRVKADQKLDLSDTGQVFQALLVSKQSGNMPKPDRDALVEVFRHFHEAGWALEQASLRCYISSIVFPSAASCFRKFFLMRCTPQLRVHLLGLGPSAEGDQFLFPLFSEFCTREFPVEIARYKTLLETADLTKPHTWFPFARAIKRKIIYHAGPTNSGKTYNALKRFKEASSGVYCSPLRLLAMEVYDTVNADGVYCSLYTGQEKKEVPFSNHAACTVEMVLTQRTLEVAVIDEIQMLTDEYRGWAWTRALLGLQADEIHVCGDPSTLSLVRDICAVTGDDMEEIFYERFEPLAVNDQSLGGDYTKIQPGDCIVSFSRKEIFAIKKAVEQATTNRCCVVYGALPPETRTHQAKLFNDPNSGYNVLVATDAVGMGLNLNIRRVIFYTLEKFNGQMLQKVSASQVKQIGGRAGRRGSIYQAGTATTFYSRDIPYLIKCLQEPFGESRSAGLFPMYEQMELFATHMPGATFSKLLDRFQETCQVDGAYFLCRNDNLKKVASIIDKVNGLTLEEKLRFILAPVNVRDPKVMGALLNFSLAYSKKLPVHLAMVAPTGSARSDLQLMDLEARHQVLSLYLWLSQHFPEEYFPQKAQAEQMAAEIALCLGESLAQTNIRILRRERPKKLSAQTRTLSSQRTPSKLGPVRAQKHNELGFRTADAAASAV